MIRTSIAVLAACGLFFASGCQSANQGANQAGQATGGAMKVPNSFSEGAAQGVAGQPNANPYNR
jgi:hypothetical protein